jgi:glycerate 2-kinase
LSRELLLNRAIVNSNSPPPSSPELLAEMRRNARNIFDYALAECNISRAFARNVDYSDGTLRAAGQRYDLHRFSSVAVVSVGKAGHSMAEELSRIVPDPLAGIVSCPVMPALPVAGFEYFLGGHPLPNEDSLRAGDAILRLLRNLPDGSLVVFMVSGGASAIVERPFYADLTMSDVIATNRVLVHAGAPIAEINAIRKHLSAIKGGRMAQAAFPATQLSLLVSDVPDYALDALGSGPTMPDSSTVNDCYNIATRFGMLVQFPSRVRAIFDHRQLDETPKEGDPAFTRSRFATVLSNHTAVHAAVEKAASMGFVVEVDNKCDDWDYVAAASYLLGRLRELRARSSRVCLVSGGEVTVHVGNRFGVGGRNQQFALYCAEQIAGAPITVLSAGTDGIDGNSSAAGAVVDGTSAARAREMALDHATALAEFNANPLLHRTGDEIITGPTGNNVRDLRILLAY